MKIFVINKFLYNRGGDAIVALNTGKLLKARGHEVFYWGMKDVRNADFPHEDLFLDEVDLNKGHGAGRQLQIAANMLYSLEAKKKIKRLIDRVGQPDIVHLHNFAHQISPSILDVFNKYKIPSVMTMHDYKMVCAAYTLIADGKICERCSGGKYFNCFQSACVKASKAKSLLNSIEMFLHHKILRIYDRISIFISPSVFLKNKINEMGFKRPVEVLPNFVDPAEYQPIFGETPKTIFYLGRISQEKGISTLINAVAGLPHIQLKIIGDGPLRAELESYIKEKNLKNIKFLGHLSGNHLTHEINVCRFIVLPSQWYENNPRSVIEAFALGKPVVGSQIGGIPELVREGETGFNFEPGNANDLAQKISSLISNPAQCLAMGQKARRLVETELNPDKHYQGLMSIYNKALSSSQR